jgi:voltage-gated potassium channel
MPRRAGPLRRARAEVRYASWAVRLLLRPLVLFVVVVIVGAVIEHQFGPGHDWSQAFFVSYTLMFLEHIEPTPEHPLAQLMHYGQPLLGVILVSEGVLRLGLNLLNKDANARKWVECMAKATKGHVIICGLGTVGFRVAEELRAMGVEVFAVEQDPTGMFVVRARELGVSVVAGDARSENLLRDLNVADARAVIVATNDDLANLEIAMDVREIRKDIPIVMRLFDQKLADKVKATLGVNVSVSTSRLAAPLFASAALDPSVVGTHRVGGTILVVVEVAIGATSALSGRTIGEVAGMGMTVIAVRPPAAVWELAPRPERGLVQGDQVQVLVPSARMEELHRLAAG